MDDFDWLKKGRRIRSVCLDVYHLIQIMLIHCGIGVVVQRFFFAVLFSIDRVVWAMIVLLAHILTHINKET